MKVINHFFLTVVFLTGCISTAMELSAQPVTPKTALEALGDLSESFEVLSDQVSPAVVQVLSTGYVVRQGSLSSSADLLPRQRNIGSGVILEPDGYIVTNAHLVEGAQRVQVVMPVSAGERSKYQSILKPGGQTIEARIVGIDRETDLAVLKVEDKELPALPLGNSDEIMKGHIVFAFGSPLGLENSVSMGVVSSVARQLQPEAPMIYIQTDATINPGNSGGPLVNTKGQVIGINTLILSQSGGSEGLSFAVPSNIVRNVFDQIRRSGRVRRGEMGVHAQTVTPTQNWGVILGDVYPGGPAELAGLRVGDLILAFDGKAMENGRQFDINLYRRAIGEIVTLEVLRGPEKFSVRVLVSERPNDPQRFFEMVSPEKNLIPELGILGIDLDPKLARMFPVLRNETGVVVAAGAMNSTYSTGGFQPGDVIHSINGQLVRNLAGLAEVLVDLKTYDPVVVHIERKGQLMFVAFEVE
jgi:serine protease Do